MSEYYSNEYLNGRPAEMDARLKAWARSRLAAADLKATEGFLQQADLEAWPPSRMKEKLKEAEGFSRAAREELGMKIDAGLVNKSTPANREATDRLMVAIDRRQEAGEPLTGLEVEALAWNCGLTTEQIIEVRKYRAEGPKRSYSGRGEVFAASTRRAVRESVMGSNVTEMNVASLVDEELARDPALVQKADRIRLNPFYRYPGGGDDVRAMLENLLPKYKDRDELRSLLAGQGVNFSDKIPIPPEGLTLARAKVYQQNLEAQEADELILGNAQPGLVSSAAELAGGLVGSLPDSLNFIPLAGGFKRVIPGTKLLSRAGLKMLGRSAMIGAGENAAGAALSDAAAFPLANRWGADLGLEQAAGDVALAGALGSAFSAAGTSIGHMKAAKGEASGPRPAPTNETGRMIKSDHPYGWSGPDRDIAPVEAEPIKRKGAADTSLTEIGSVPAPQRPVVSSLVYNQNGTLHLAESKRSVKKTFTNILESWGLESAKPDKGPVGARKILPTHEQTGWSVEIGKGDLGEILNTAQTEADFVAMEYIPELWRTSAYKKPENWAEAKKKGTVKDFYKAVHEFENEIKIGEEHYSVKITVKETAHGRHYYHQKLAPK